MLNGNFVYLGVAIFSIGGISYLIDTLRGKVQPNKVTWLLWAISPLVAFAAEIVQGVGLISLTTFIAGFLPLLIFMASFVNKKSYWKLTKFDYVCGGLSLLGLLLWYLTRSGNIAIIFSLLADFLAATPTFIKAFRSPESESAKAFFLVTLGSCVSFLTIATWTFANYAFPAYLVLSDLTLFVLIYFKVGKRAN